MTPEQIINEAYQRIGGAPDAGTFPMLIARDRCDYCGRPREVLLDQRPGRKSKANLPLGCRTLGKCASECARQPMGPV